MKSTMVPLLLIISSFAFVHATSGACSGHGGVDCSLGQDSDGSVICVDGWRNSSVSYASMVKCAGYSVQEETVNTDTTPEPVVEPVVILPSAKPVEQLPVTPIWVAESKAQQESKPGQVKQAVTLEKYREARSLSTSTATSTKRETQIEHQKRTSVAKRSAPLSFFKSLRFW